MKEKQLDKMVSEAVSCLNRKGVNYLVIAAGHDKKDLVGSLSYTVGHDAIEDLSMGLIKAIIDGKAYDLFVMLCEVMRLFPFAVDTCGVKEEFGKGLDDYLRKNYPEDFESEKGQDGAANQ